MQTGAFDRSLPAETPGQAERSKHAWTDPVAAGFRTHGLDGELTVSYCASLPSRIPFRILASAIDAGRSQ